MRLDPGQSGCPRTGPKTRECRKLYNLCSSPNIIKPIKYGGKRWACSMHERKRNAYKISVEKRDAKIPLGRPMCRYEDNIKMDTREIKFDGME
jgi:hypothetical protein